VIDRIVEKLKAFSAESILSTEEFRGDLTVRVRPEDIVRVCTFLRDDPDLAFALIVDVLGVDRYLPEGRFEVIYIIYSLRNKIYVRLRVSLEESNPVVQTVSGVWPGANWYEREAYDMFGIRFEGHPDLRRMYMPEEFEYYPLRKDFPLMGIPDSLALPRR
jgi:NADH-quinone oxidoreductase subunit C